MLHGFITHVIECILHPDSALRARVQIILCCHCFMCIQIASKPIILVSGSIYWSTGTSLASHVSYVSLHACFFVQSQPCWHKPGFPVRTEATLLLLLQVWFWRFRVPHNAIVTERLAKQSEAQAVVTKLNKQRAATKSEAKSQLGLWSDAGIEEARGGFW